jgi:hypothetical protein
MGGGGGGGFQIERKRSIRQVVIYSIIRVGWVMLTPFLTVNVIHKINKLHCHTYTATHPPGWPEAASEP